MIHGASEVDEPITITDYDPAWPALFAAEGERVMRAAGDIVTRVEHFGSTAVPGMAGKPIVDLLVGVRDLEEASPRVPALEALGYENFGEIFIPGRLYLRRRGPPHFNVAITAEGGEFWNAQIMVRDFLRAHPAEAEAYAAIKRSTYAGGARLFSTYSQAKGPFLAALKERAQKWHEQQRAGTTGTRGTTNGRPVLDDWNTIVHTVHWLRVLATPRFFHGLGRVPPREHLLGLLDTFLAYLGHDGRYVSAEFEPVPYEQREPLARRLRALIKAWTPPGLPQEIVETARALLHAEGVREPAHGWDNVPAPSDLPPGLTMADYLLWPEGVPAFLGGQAHELA